jgi:hypothetical protein
MPKFVALRRLVVHNVTKWRSLVTALKDMKWLEELVFGIEKNVSMETLFTAYSY